MSKRSLFINIVSACLLLCICVGAFIMADRSRPKPPTLPEDAEYLIDDTVAVAHFDYMGDEEFLVGDWSGDYDLQYVHGACAQYCWGFGVMDYAQYVDFCSLCSDGGYRQIYDNPSKNYVFCGAMQRDGDGYEARLGAAVLNGEIAHLYVWDRVQNPVHGNGAAYMIIVPTDQEIKTVNVHPLYFTLNEYAEMKEYDVYEPEAEKPIIYLYPEKETDVTVTLGHPECITHSYPKYDGPWRVTAQPDGTLTDLETGRELYSLYYENVSPVPLPQTEEGFVIRGEDTAAFLEEKLAILGLSPREAEEFIVYWLPRLEENEWNYIRFASRAEIDAEMPLEITPQPDSTIRVLMLWKALDAPIEVREQKLPTPPRTGFTSVEWGGAEIH